MTITEIRTRYQDNIMVIDKLENLYKESKYSDKTIKESIDIVKNEQDLLYKKIKSHVYKSLSKKNMSFLMNSTSKTKEETDKEIVLDKDSVTVSDVDESKKDAENIKVINITEKEPDEKEQLAINVKKEKDNTVKDFKDVRIVVDGDYKLLDKNGNVLYMEKSNDLLLDISASDKQNVHNYIITGMLRKIDYENETKLLDDYYNGTMRVSYNIDKLNKSYNKKTLKSTIKVAKKEYKSGKNVEIKDNRFKKIKLGLGTIAAAGLMIAGSLGLSKITSKNKSVAKENVSIESMNDAGPSDASYEAVELKESSMITEVPNLEFEKEIVSNDTLSKQADIVENEETNTIQIGDTFILDSVDLYESSTDTNAVGNTSHIENSIYEVGLVSIVYDNRVIKVVDNNSDDLDQLRTELEEKYGDSIEFKYNLNQLNTNGEKVTDQVGWSLEEQLQNKGKVLKR